ncbi:FmdB family zinc ribbon protein [Ideonella sp. A 288]|uniref:FmdB family zinc ribbon protein n=1 Tax=Ideonella sp. A 288 TaxID=1962181 RepID=UPI000B4B6445|nr:zinc ribbon domain-containing protein [Ideonella sp. A 288]
MATYEYRCEQHGLFDVLRPLGTAPASVDCPQCGSASPRAMSAPMFKSSRHQAVMAAMDRAQKSRHEPEVVTSLPPVGGPRRTVTLTPELRRLPRL